MRKIGDTLTPLGIEWYAGISPIRGEPKDKIRSKDSEDFSALFNASCLIADAGGNVMLVYDDTRFPISPADVKDFGTAREADVYLLNKLYAALRERYPKERLLFCPPFYWGPPYPPDYPEPRDAYLRALGDRLPPDVGIFWTGPAVCSSIVTKEQVAWITGLLRRKPWFWQNGMGAPHMFGYHYVTDPLTSWPDWCYRGLFEQIEAYLLNTNVPHNCAALLTLVDYLWNRNGYDPKRSVEETAKKLTGPETYPVLSKLVEKLSYLDRYGLRVSPGAARNIVEIRKCVADLEQTWQQCLAFHPEAVTTWTSLQVHVSQQKQFLTNLESNPDLSVFVRSIAVMKELAQKETHLDPTQDVFLSAFDFSGGNPAELYSFRCESRYATWAYGAKTNTHSMTAGFHLPTPPTSPATLILCGQDDDGPGKCRIRILMNNNEVFSGENPFVQFGWSLHAFPVKASFLKAGDNVLSLRNIEESAVNLGPPFFMLNYAVLKKGDLAQPGD